MRTIIRICMLYIFMMTLSSASMETGITWLQQNTSSKENIEVYANISTALQASSETFFTLYDLNESYNSLIFPPSELNTTEDISRLITYHKLQGNEPLQYIEKLITYQNNDGGFGEREGYESTILDTAFAIKALAYTHKDEVIRSAVHYIKTNQLVSGAWMDHIESDAVYITMMTLESLFLVSHENDTKNTIFYGEQYLLSQRDNDLWSEVYLNALGLNILSPIVTDKSVLETSFNFIKNTQMASGSWNEDIYTTALALRGLDLYLNPRNPDIINQDKNISIFGMVRDSTSDLPIKGARVHLSGANNRILFTNTQGEFNFDQLLEGVTNINYSIDGYISIDRSIGLVKNVQYDMGRTLKKINLNASINISGKLISENNASIANANVTLLGYGQVNTNSSGEFLFSDVTSRDGNAISIDCKANGFNSKLFVFNLDHGIHNIDVGSLILKEGSNEQNLTSKSIISGYVKDKNGNPLVGVRVSILHTNDFVFSDANGFYSIEKKYTLENISQHQFGFALIFEHDGFISGFKHFELQHPYNITFNIQLLKQNNIHLNINSVLLNKDTYQAYSQVDIVTEIENLGLLAQHVSVEVDIRRGDTVLDTLVNDYQNYSLKDTLIVPSLTNKKQFKWYTGINEPGEYIAQVKLFDANNTLLASSRQPFTIEASKKIEKLSLDIADHIYYVKETQKVLPSIYLINYSNIKHTIEIEFSILSASKDEIDNETVTIDIYPKEIMKKITLLPKDIYFPEEGIYPVTIKIKEGVVPVDIVNSTLTVLPKLRIVPSQKLSPKVIAPDGQKTIKIMIDIRGEQ